MGRGESENLGSGGESPGEIFKRVTPEYLFHIDGVATSGVPVCPAHNNRCWNPLCAT